MATAGAIRQEDLEKCQDYLYYLTGIEPNIYKGRVDSKTNENPLRVKHLRFTFKPEQQSEFIHLRTLLRIFDIEHNAALYRPTTKSRTEISERYITVCHDQLEKLATLLPNRGELSLARSSEEDAAAESQKESNGHYNFFGEVTPQEKALLFDLCFDNFRQTFVDEVIDRIRKKNPKNVGKTNTQAKLREELDNFVGNFVQLKVRKGILYEPPQEIHAWQSLGPTPSPALSFSLRSSSGSQKSTGSLKDSQDPTEAKEKKNSRTAPPGKKRKG